MIEVLLVLILLAVIAPGAVAFLIAATITVSLAVVFYGALVAGFLSLLAWFGG